MRRIATVFAFPLSVAAVPAGSAGSVTSRSALKRFVLGQHGWTATSRKVLTSPSRRSISSGLSRSLSPVLEQSLSRRRFLVAAGAGVASLAFPKLGSSVRGIHPADNVILQWNGAFLEGVRNSKLGPPMVARALAVAHTCIYDAWAAYDNKAVGTLLGSSLRRPGPR